MKALLAISPTRLSAIDKALIAKTRGMTHGMPHERAAIENAVFADDKAVHAVLSRSAVAIADTGTAGWAGELADNAVASYVATLAPMSAAAKIIGMGMQVTMGRAGTEKYPARETAPATTVPWTGEGDPIPMGSFELNNDCELSPKKFAFMVGTSRELARRLGGDAVIRQLIREDAASILDAAYFNNVAADSATHAGMLAGITAFTGYGGGDRVAMENDLVALSDAVSAGGSGELVFVVSPRRANRVRILYPDLARDLTFLPSLAVADTTAIAVDPASWLHGYGDQVDIEVSPYATVHMDTDPDPIVMSGTPAAAVRSYYQTDSLAYRFITDLAFAARRTNAAAWTTGLTW